MHMIFKFSNHLFLLFLLISCKGDLLDPVPQSQSVLKLYASPGLGSVGDKIRIYGTTFHDHVRIRFNNNTHTTRSDSFNLITAYTYIPFDAKSGDILVEFGDSIGIVDDFEVVEQCEDTICVLPYDLNFPITKFSATKYYPDYPYEFNWAISINSDTVIVSSYHQAWSEGFSRFNIVFLNKNYPQLPELIDFHQIDYLDAGGPRISYFKNYVVKIQDWDLNGIISGRIISS